MRAILWLVAVPGVLVGCAAPLPTDVAGDRDAQVADARAPSTTETRTWYPFCVTYSGFRGCIRFDVTATRTKETVRLHIEVQNLEGSLIPVNATPASWLQVNGFMLDRGGTIGPTSVRLVRMGTQGKVTRADKATTLYSLGEARYAGGTQLNVVLRNGSGLYAEPAAITGCTGPTLGFSTCPRTGDGRVFWDVEFMSADWALSKAVLGVGFSMSAGGTYIGIGCTETAVDSACEVIPQP